MRDFPHPISVARKVMETPHVLLTGAGAEAFAEQHGFTRADLLSENAVNAS